MTVQKNSVSHTTCLLGKCLRGSMNLFSGKMFTVLLHLQPETLLKSKAALILGKRKTTSILRPFCPMEMAHTRLEGFSLYSFFLLVFVDFFIFLPKFLRKLQALHLLVSVLLQGQSESCLLPSYFLKDALRTREKSSIASECPYGSPATALL